MQLGYPCNLEFAIQASDKAKKCWLMFKKNHLIKTSLAEWGGKGGSGDYKIIIVRTIGTIIDLIRISPEKHNTWL